MPIQILTIPIFSRVNMGVFLFCGLLNIEVLHCCCSQEEAVQQSIFQGEFKKIFGAGQSTKLTAVEYLEKLVAGESNDREFKRQIGLLGSEEYVQRQTAEAFLFSVPVLPEKYKAFAAQSADMEVRYRLNSIYMNRKNRVESLVIAALQTVAEQKETAALPNVFKVLVGSESGKIKSTASLVARSLVTKEHGVLLQHQLNAEAAEVRFLAASLMVQAGVESAYAKISLLLDDQDDWVRLQIAKLLVDQNRKVGFVTLVLLLESEDLAIASRAERVLRAVTGEGLGQISYTNREDNAKLIQAWTEWQAANLASIKLRLPIVKFLKNGSRLNGNMLIAKDQKIVIELDVNRKEVFRLSVDGVLSAEKTSEGNYLLFSYSGRWLKEYNVQKKVNWEINGVKFNNAMPLVNGNVLVSVGPGSIVKEIDPSTKETVWEFDTSWWPNDAYRLKNGNTLIGGKGGVVEVTPKREVVWEYKNPETATIVVAKPVENGGILVGWTSGQARVINREKKTIWEHKVKSLSDVFRDSEGHTFFATASEIIELDAEKNIIWKIPKQAKTATIRR